MSRSTIGLPRASSQPRQYVMAESDPVTFVSFDFVITSLNRLFMPCSDPFCEGRERKGRKAKGRRGKGREGQCQDVMK